jgi:hypothetical protein
MLFWDKQMKAARVIARLRALGPPAWVSFAAGSLDHAFRLACHLDSWKNQDTTRNHIESALGRAWEFVQKGRTLGDSAVVVKAMLQGAPDEDNPGIPGEDNLLSGAIELVRLSDKASLDKIKASMGSAEAIASYGYQAVMDLSIPHVSGGEAAVEAAERGSPACQQEIAFQVSYLDALERLGRAPPILADVLSAIQK